MDGYMQAESAGDRVGIALPYFTFAGHQCCGLYDPPSLPPPLMGIRMPPPPTLCHQPSRVTDESVKHSIIDIKVKIAPTSGHPSSDITRSAQPGDDVFATHQECSELSPLSHAQQRLLIS